MRRTVLIVFALLTCAGCTLPGGGGQTSAPPTPSTAASTQPSVATTTPPAAPPTPDAVLASRATSYEGTKAKVDLNQVVVTGDVTTITWTLTNLSGKDSLQLVGGLYKDTGVFSDRLVATVPGSDKDVENDLRVADGVYLVDTVNKRRYLPARDSAGVCLCSETPRWETLKPEAAMAFSATYRAIPAGVDTVNVAIPGVGTFVNVPVQR